MSEETEEKREVGLAKRPGGPGANRGSGLLVALILASFAVGLLANWGYTTYAINQARSQNAQTQRAQEAQGQQVEARLCTTLARLAGTRPPASLDPHDAAVNPGRRFDLQMHATLSELFPDIQCPAKYLSR